MIARVVQSGLSELSAQLFGRKTPGFPRLAWLGLAWLGLVWFGLAWLGLARFGLARLRRLPRTPRPSPVEELSRASFSSSSRFAATQTPQDVDETVTMSGHTRTQCMSSPESSPHLS